MVPDLSQSDGGSASIVPAAGATIHSATRAMACEFSVILNASAREQIYSAGEVLQVFPDIESWLSTYRPDSDLSRVNANAATGPEKVRPELFDLLVTAGELFQKTDRAFDMASGRLIQLWHQCRQDRRLPSDSELAAALQQSGFDHVTLNSAAGEVRFETGGLLLNPGAIGKGFALDQAWQWMPKLEDTPADFLIHGGHSSLVAGGRHDGLDGWPVGIGNPLLTKKRLGTLLLSDRAMSTSGSNIQFYRHQGRRFGHILDPRTGWPVDGVLSVTVVADSALLADVLSTAFYVLGIEDSLRVADRFPDVGMILVPPPKVGATIEPIVRGIAADRMFWDSEAVRRVSQG